MENMALFTISSQYHPITLLVFPWPNTNKGPSSFLAWVSCNVHDTENDINRVSSSYIVLRLILNHIVPLMTLSWAFIHRVIYRSRLHVSWWQHWFLCYILVIVMVCILNSQLKMFVSIRRVFLKANFAFPNSLLTLLHLSLSLPTSLSIGHVLLAGLKPFQNLTSTLSVEMSWTLLAPFVYEITTNDSLPVEVVTFSAQGGSFPSIFKSSINCHRHMMPTAFIHGFPHSFVSLSWRYVYSFAYWSD
jgi:hypothetical protein